MAWYNIKFFGYGGQVELDLRGTADVREVKRWMGNSAQNIFVLKAGIIRLDRLTKGWEMKVLLVALCLCSMLPACRDSDPKSSNDSPISIRSGTSFGECIGYCWTELHATRDAMALVRRGWDSSEYPEQQFSDGIDAQQWDRLVSLIDFEKMQSMEEVYGCPDCVDGGAEWIEVAIGGEIKKVTFEYGATLEPLAELIEAIRVLREEFIREVVPAGTG